MTDDEKARWIASIREQLTAVLGDPLDDVSDERIAALLETWEQMGESVGMTTDEAIEALRRAGRVE